MKTISHHYPKWGYHNWRDIGGPLGFVLEFLFCGVVVVAAFFMIAFCSILLVLDYLFAPVLTLVSRLKGKAAA